MERKKLSSQDTGRWEPSENAAGLASGAVSTNAKPRPAPNHRSRLRQAAGALALSMLLLAAGTALLVLDRNTLFAMFLCQSTGLTCSPWWEAPAFGIAVFAWAIAGVAVDGVRGRPYSRWLTAAVVLLSVYLLVALVTRGVL